ncbi:hypothetical protein HHK36_016791 [Tetracentron sinense]|uniref:Histidine-containing phosphotransfer protein n=1 Tax=Tetracentron sinense TaxID=13715 RepID=A0A834Z5X7_TETSI|nr:hypothetical protein HHK36_016791 [Tetracentron sinense]
MALAALKAQLKGFVQSLIDEGILDRQFYQVQALQDTNNPRFVVEVITMFFNGSRVTLIELTKYLDQHSVNYGKVNDYVHQLKGSCLSIGAHRMKLACLDLRHACDGNHKEGQGQEMRSIQWSLSASIEDLLGLIKWCLLALNRIKHEYYHLQSKLETVVQVSVGHIWRRESFPMRPGNNGSRASVILHLPPGLSIEFL